MLGRRSYTRFKVVPSAEGTLRILNDIAVHGSTSNEWIAISREAAVVGEILSLNVGDGDSTRQFPVVVMDCRPAIIGGLLRHRLRLRTDQSDSDRR